MRTPKKPGGPDIPDKDVPGGRAWKRVEQFQRQRGVKTVRPASVEAQIDKASPEPKEKKSGPGERARPSTRRPESKR